jgi:hypothetical protein
MEEVEPRREQRPRAMQAATGSLPFRGICTSVYVRAIAEMRKSRPAQDARLGQGLRELSWRDKKVPRPRVREPD